MKLSEMDTRTLSACLLNIAGPLERIGTSREIEAAMKTIAGHTEGETTLAKLSVILGQLIPALLGSHFEDTVAILAAMTGKTPDEVARQSGMQTIRDAAACIDGEFLRFFGLSDPPEPEA